MLVGAVVVGAVEVVETRMETTVPNVGAVAHKVGIMEAQIRVVGMYATTSLSVGVLVEILALQTPTFSGPSTTCFRDVIVNGSYNSCVQMGPSALPTAPGNHGRNVERAMQERFCQDNVKTVSVAGDPFTYQEYLAAKAIAGGAKRRVIRVAFNDGVPNGHSIYNVVGFGCFFMPSCPNTNPPSTALCLQFIGACDENGDPVPPGASPSITKLVLFR